MFQPKGALVIARTPVRFLFMPEFLLQTFPHLLSDEIIVSRTGS